VLYDLFWSSREPTERFAAARRYLENVSSAQELESAESIASSLALHLAERQPEEAFTVATTWRQRCKDAGLKPSELAHTLAALELRRAQPAAAAPWLREAISFLDPEHFDFARQQFEWKLELLEACRKAGLPDPTLEQEIKAARAEWAADWLAALPKKSRQRAAVPILEPWLRPEGRYGPAPFEAVDAAGKAVGPRFLKMQINDRPPHGQLIEVCRPHARVSTFSGHSGGDLTIESLETRDTPQVREAFSSADDVHPLADGRIHFWWD
jgi:hypothetical protein